MPPRLTTLLMRPYGNSSIGEQNFGMTSVRLCRIMNHRSAFLLFLPFFPLCSALFPIALSLFFPLCGFPAGRVDPARAAMLHPNDERKILRSLQVYHQKHERHSNLLDQRIPRFAKCCVLWVHCDLTVLDTRLDQRVDEMVATGLLQELRAFYAHLDQDPPPLLTTDDMGLDYTKGVLQAIGVKEFKLLLSTGGKAAAADEVVAKRPCHSGGGSPLNQDEKEDAETQLCLEKMKQATRRYARRQLLWVRRRFLIRPRSLQTRQYAVFRLDSTAPQQWEQLVRQPAMEMVSAFMKASDVWPPAAMAAHRVDLEEKDADPPVPIAKHYTCPDCKNRLFVGEHQWQAHLHSRGHRKRCQGNSKRRGEASKGASASTS